MSLTHDRPAAAVPNDLESFWMPFTPNKSFKERPRLIKRAKGMYYETVDGRQILDACAGLWCSNAGHCREPIVRAIQAQAAELDFAPSFQYSHPQAFELAARLAQLAPGALDHVFFTNSGSEAVESALKAAIAYHRLRGEGGRTRLIGREKGYHGTNFGGISVGGMVNNRKFFGPLLAGVDHLPATYVREHQRFSKGEPEWGAHLADDLERLCALHDPSTIAAVIVEPMAGSSGVLPPPKGYLERLREITRKHGILLIFDEVITGFGRLGHAFAAERYGVEPDMITFAKGVTSGTVPMGGVLAARHVFEAFAEAKAHEIKFFHGYTYSAHPMATAAALAALDLYRDEGLFERAGELEPYFQEAVHRLADHPLVEDIRNVGLAAAFDITPEPGDPGKRGYRVMERLFHENGLLARISGDTVVFAPPLIVEMADIDRMVETLEAALDAERA